MNKALSIFNQLRPVTIGFDSIFDNFERMFEDDFFNTSTSYPAYDIVKTGENQYDVEVALAGFNKKDIKVSYADGQLSIESVKNDKTKDLTFFMCTTETSKAHRDKAKSLGVRGWIHKPYKDSQIIHLVEFMVKELLGDTA